MERSAIKKILKKIEDKEEKKMVKSIGGCKSGIFKNEKLSEPASIYYDIFMGNPNPYLIDAIYTETRSDSLVDKADDWQLIITKFTVPIQQVPIFVPVFIDEEKLITAYSVTLTWDGNPAVQEFIIYKPLNYDSSTGTFGNFIFSYQHFIDLINAAFQAAFVIASGYAGWPAGATKAPYLTYDAGSELITLHAQVAYQNANANVYGSATYTPEASGEIGIYMNGSLFTFFDSWKAFSRGFNSADGKDFQLLVMNNLNNLDTSVVPNEYKMIQEFPTLYLWQDIHAIIIVTSELPIRSEFIQFNQINTIDSAPTVTDAGTVSPSGLSVLATFDIQTMIQASRGVVQFVVGSEFKTIDLLGQNKINKADFTVYWQDRNSNLFLVQIPPGRVFDIQLLFRKKIVKDVP
jgi:hypothetical protein